MLSAAVRRGVSLCASGARAYARGARSRPRPVNPGLDERAAALKEGGIDLPADMDLEEMLEESEANMQNAHHAYDQHTREARVQRETLRHQIVQRKYASEEMPNLLTWSEKEQIRYLIGEHPDEWTPERIAESFPVTPQVVKKLVKYPWKPSSVERIARHDHSAMRNWRELKEGTLDIPPELREHFLKFSNRTIPPLKETSIKPDIPPETMGEFQSIIARCASKQREREEMEAQKTEKQEEIHIVKDDSLQTLPQLSSEPETEPKYDPKRYTLDRLKEKISRDLTKGKDVNLSEQLILSSGVRDDAVTSVSASEISLEQAKEDELAVLEKDREVDVAPIVYPERIRIPKSAWKRGGTFRLKDCYYDDDGRFLYRVPGLH